MTHAAGSKVGIIVTVHNRWNDYGRPCIESLLRCTPGDRKIIVFDNESGDGTVPVGLESVEWVRVDDQQAAGGLTGTWNRGIAMAIGMGCTRLVLLNHDTVVDGTWPVFLDAIRTDPLAVFGPVTDKPGTGIHWGQGPVTGPESPGRIVVAEGMNGFCMGAQADLFILNKYDAEHYFNPHLPFGGNETEWRHRLQAKGGTCKVVTGCFVHHKKGGEWRRLSWHQ